MQEGTQTRRLLHALRTLLYIGPIRMALWKLSTSCWGSWLTEAALEAVQGSVLQLTATRREAALAFSPLERDWVCVLAVWPSPLWGTELVLPPQSSSNTAGRRALLLKLPCGE